MAALTDYIGLLPSASSEQPNFVAFVSALLQPFVDVQNTVLGFPGAFDIDNAVGVQLDGVGERVGLSRKLSVPITGVYFALDGNVGPLITGNGATASAQLPSDLDLTKVSIYRDDWQGHTLLSTTPRTNLFLFSDDFSNVAWTKANASSVSGGVTAPDGTNTAFKLKGVAGTALAPPDIRQIVTLGSGASVVSFYAKAGEKPWVYVNSLGRTPTDADVRVYFNLSTGTVGSSTNGGVGSIQAVGNGWYRCSVLQTGVVAASTQREGRFGIVDGNGSVSFSSTGTEGVYVWRGQFAPGSVDTSGIPTTTAPASVTDCTISGTGLVTINPTPPVGTNITWLDTRPGVGLDEGVIRGPFDPVEALTSLDDETYRLMLRIKILANNWDGSLEDAQQMLAALQTAGTYLFMQDLFDMSLVLGVSGKVPSKLFVSILRQMNDWLRPGAVDSAVMVTSVSGAPIFGLDVQNSYIGGLDVGTVALPY